MQVRVRYAPSPTGKQHIGGLRTALFNYLFARSLGGKFILRIEDTDRDRFDPAALQDIYDTFEWLGISWDEGPDKGGQYGPYVQSERRELYQTHAKQLVEQGRAYPCFCTSERLEQLRQEQQKDKKSFGYDRRCRDLPAEQSQALIDKGQSYVVRLKVPLEGDVRFEDVLLGGIKRKPKDINPDPVLLKSDGFPTYHLANVVDDHLMGITHILRAQEWIPSVPVHVLLYRAFGWAPPQFCHLPMVMGKDVQKLSKRHGATSVIEFRKAGYLPEALLNYLALLGWSYDDSREFFTLAELEKVFTLDKLNKAPGVFDYKKLDWFNGQYIRKLEPEALKVLVLPYLVNDGLISSPPSPSEIEKINGILPLARERLKVLSDIGPLSAFIFKEPVVPGAEALVPKRLDREQTRQVLHECLVLIGKLEQSSNEEMENLFRQSAERLAVKPGDLLMPLRVAVTGSAISPPLTESMRLLGVSITTGRIKKALARINV